MRQNLFNCSKSRKSWKKGAVEMAIINFKMSLVATKKLQFCRKTDKKSLEIRWRKKSFDLVQLSKGFMKNKRNCGQIS